MAIVSLPARAPEVVEKHPNIVPVRLDVDDDASVQDCVAKVGPVDVLVNSAGIGIAGTIEMVPMQKIRAMFETNFFGAVRMMQAVLPLRSKCGTRGADAEVYVATKDRLSTSDWVELMSLEDDAEFLHAPKMHSA
jgi:NAD(P)-dependent dehydrogenase (short-subunit alcohol dehydrogenase family)